MNEPKKRRKKRRRRHASPGQVIPTVIDLLERHPDVRKSLQTLLDAGCQLEVLIGLAWAHCRDEQDTLTDSLARLRKSLSKTLERTEVLMKQVEDLGYSVKLVERLELVELWHSLKRYEFIFQHVSHKKFSEPRQKIRIYLPLLCIYVHQVTRKPHWVDLAALLRSLAIASGVEEEHEHLTDSAVRHAQERYQADNSEEYHQLETATNIFLKTARREGEDATALLLMLAFLETGIVPLKPRQIRT